MRILSNLAVITFIVLLAACDEPPVKPTAAVESALPEATATPVPLSSGEPPPCTETGQTWVSPIDGVILVCVPAGEFLMGAAEDDAQALDREKPQHKVYLDAFWIDQTEVSNRQYAQCQVEGGCERDLNSGDSSLTRPDYLGNPAYDRYPALIFIADDAAEYCAWAGRRLPTEAEWEKAARGTDGRLYAWGDTLDCERANVDGCLEDTSAGDSHPAGASPYGALHMTGNVWEWVADWYDPAYYARSPAQNPQGPETGRYNIRRGGGWRSLTAHLRASNRASGAPRHYFDGQMGFRCAVRAASGR